ncbi:MAG: heat-inducible transcriptional repressor HrcA [Oscillospiraceae bacterium]|nr:heat-inducible transcriptional repressor HrcA [Oscillospiraceae bacterium]
MRDIDERKLKILGSVVLRHVESGEPVGSKTVADMFGASVSSATIRNEMALLEHAGMLEQPHASAGRIPTTLGYKTYIDRIMQPSPLREDEKKLIDNMLVSNSATVGEIVENAVAALVELTGYASIKLSGNPGFTVISRVEAIPAGYRLYALLVITTSGDVKNKVCRTSFDITSEQLEIFTNLVNKEVAGIRAEELAPEFIENIALSLGGYVCVLSPLLQSMYELSEELKRSSVVIRGEERLIAQKSFDKDELLRLMAGKDRLANLLTSAFEGVNVIFGRDNNEFMVSNSSLVLSGYDFGDVHSNFGIIGPIRLDYSKIIPYMDYFSASVKKEIAKILDDEEEHDERKA